MEEMFTLYETNWSLFGVDGELLPGPTSPLSEQWHQQDDLIKCVGGPSDGAPSMMDQLVSVQQALEPGNIEDSWLDNKTDIVELLLAGDEVAKSEPKVSESCDIELAPVTSILPPVSEDEAIEKLLESLERHVPEGVVNLENGQTGSESLLELLTSEVDTRGDTVTLTADEIDSILSSNPSSPVGSIDDSCDSDLNWSPSGSNNTSMKSVQSSTSKSGIPFSYHRPVPYVKKPDRNVYTKCDKKLRKKEQNRTAATRYRQKKKQEQDSCISEYMVLENRNKDLKESVESISQEIAYLKNLMAEVYKARKHSKK